MTIQTPRKGTGGAKLDITNACSVDNPSGKIGSSILAYQTTLRAETSGPDVGALGPRGSHG